MLIQVADGRLGNQLFQLAFALSNAREDERILFFNGEMVRRGFVIDPSVRIFGGHNKIFQHIFYLKVLVGALDCLAALRLIGYIYENKGKTVRRRGVFSAFRYIKPTFYQGERFFDTNAVKKWLRIKPAHLAAAKAYLTKLPQDGGFAFVHVRRGDYLTFSMHGVQDVSLPLGYYRAAMDQIRTRARKTRFVVLSDDTEYAREKFAHEDCYVSENSEYVDMAIMTLCTSGVLSCSTFSWWGAFMMSKRENVIGPLFWTGFKSRIWHPPESDIKASFVEYIEVSEEN